MFNETWVEEVKAGAGGGGGSNKTKVQSIQLITDCMLFFYAENSIMLLWVMINTNTEILQRSCQAAARRCPIIKKTS